LSSIYDKKIPIYMAYLLLIILHDCLKQ